MTSRRSLLQHRRIAALIVACALLMKLLVPAGYMVTSDNGRLGIALCSGAAPRATASMPGMAGHHGGKQDHGKAEMPCAFAALTTAVVTGADATLLAGAIVFIMATAFRSVVAAPPAPAPFLRPPLRGPPLSF